MGRIAAGQVVLLTGVLVAALVSSEQANGTTLKCGCSDCPQGETLCYGDVCTREAILNPVTGEILSARTRCSNDSLERCNISSPYISINCCDTHDFCNVDNHTDTPAQNETGDVTCESINSTKTANYSANSENSTANCSGPANNDTTPPAASQPSFENGMRFMCYEAESSNPHVFINTFCETIKSCFNILRVKSDGSRVFKWGCTGEGPSQSCAEENRNRKKKICCRSSFCNQNISSDWIKGGDNTTTPTETTPTQATPTPVNSTRPPAAVITIDVAPTGEEDDNCTRARRGSSSSATLDNNCPWPGTGSVPDLTPDEVIPVPPELLPGGGTWRYLCYCTVCEESYLCGSNYGCAISYHHSPGGPPRIIARHFCMDAQYFATCGTRPGHVCCTADLCNTPHNTDLTESRPTGGHNDTVATEPITVATDPVTMATTSQPTGDPTTVNPSTPPTSFNSSGTEFEPNGEEDVSLLFYSLSGLLAILVMSLAVVMFVLVFCCCGYHRRVHRKGRSSPRQQCITVPTRQERMPNTVPGSKFVAISQEKRALMLVKVGGTESSKVEIGSCVTDSTYTHSSPESTV